MRFPGCHFGEEKITGAGSIRMLLPPRIETNTTLPGMRWPASAFVMTEIASANGDS